MFRNYSNSTFKLRSPNDSLMVMGVALMLLGVIAFFMKEGGILLGIGVFVRLLIIFWMPKAAELVNRSKVTWTVLALFSPAIAFISLGSIGYKNSPETAQIVNECTSKLNDEFERLQKAMQQGEISQEQVDFEINEYAEELQEYAKQNLTSIFDTPNNEYLNHQLKKQGYLLEDNSEVLVEYSDRCPGCNTHLTDDVDTCPECGLRLK